MSRPPGWPPEPWSVDFTRGELLDANDHHIVTVILGPGKEGRKALLVLFCESANLQAAGEHLAEILAGAMDDLLRCDDPVQREARRYAVAQFETALLDARFRDRQGGR